MNKFDEKFAKFQPVQPQIYPATHSAGQNNRITVNDVQTRFVSSMIFGVVALVISIGLFAFANIHWLLSLPVGLAVFTGFYFVEIKDAKQYQAPVSAYGPTQSPAEPQRVTHVITAELKTPNGMQIAEFECDPVALKAFAGMVTRGKPFSEKTALTAGITQSQFNAMRDQFIKLDWAEWKNPAWPKAGVRLLLPGVAWIENVEGK